MDEEAVSETAHIFVIAWVLGAVAMAHLLAWALAHTRRWPPNPVRFILVVLAWPITLAFIVMEILDV